MVWDIQFQLRILLYRLVKRDCSEVPIQSGNGIYKIIPLNSGDQEIDVYCDNKLSEGGWTVNIIPNLN